MTNEYRLRYRRPTTNASHLVADEHDGNVGDIGAADRVDLGPDRTQLVERLPADDRVDEDERVALGDGEALHCRELVATGSVCYLQRAHLDTRTTRNRNLEEKKQEGLAVAMIARDDPPPLPPVITASSRPTIRVRRCQ